MRAKQSVTTREAKRNPSPEATDRVAKNWKTPTVKALSHKMTSTGGSKGGDGLSQS